jgi:hypothetical protein
MARSRMFLAMVAVALCGSLVFIGVASAHNINVAATKTKVRKYVQRVLDDPKVPYTRATTSCRLKFKGHSHYAICDVTYGTPQDTSACREKIQAYIQVSESGRSFEGDGTIYTMHISKPCGRVRLIAAKPQVRP